MPNELKSKQFAKRSLGQNFLVDRAVVDKIVAAVDPSPDDVVLEIGPGRGALTERLVEQAGTVYALEFDRDLAPMLRERFAAQVGLIVIEDDALSFDFRSLKQGERKLKLVANLPYNISTAILQRLFDVPDVFANCVLMFQREVVERITAAPGTKDRGYLSVLAEAHFDIERLFDVPPSAFRPVPKVWSAVIRLTPSRRSTLPEAFRRVIASGFGQKRKTVANNLKAKFPNYREALKAAGIDPQRRAEALTLDEWCRLSEAVSSEK